VRKEGQKLLWSLPASTQREDEKDNDDEIYFDIAHVCKIAVINHAEPQEKIRVTKIPTDGRSIFFSVNKAFIISQSQSGQLRSR
jgi:hypothetical protein